MAEPKTESTERELNDEQVEKFAEVFGIKEDDAAKRREAVLAAFADFAPKQESGGGEGGGESGGGQGGEGGSGTGDGEGTNAPASTPGVSLSAEEKTRLFSDASAAREFVENAKKSRIEANLKTSARMGKIDPKDFDHWRGFMESNYDLAVESLAKLPVNRELLVAYGSDESGDGADNREEEIYKTYAAMTHVPVRPKEAA